MKQVTVHKNRTTKILVDLGYDASGDEFTSEIREEEDQESELIATWSIESSTEDGNTTLTLTMDDSDVSEVEKSVGYMDIKRVTGGEPLVVWDDTLQVLFKKSVTV